MRAAGPGNITRLLAAALAAAALAPFPLAQAGDTSPGAGPPPATIRVAGDARITAKPDRVQIDVGVDTRAALSQEAAAQILTTVAASMTGSVRIIGPSQEGGVSAIPPRYRRWSWCATQSANGGLRRYS